MGTPFFILAIDGGGYRGLFAAHVLRRIEQEWRPDWHDHFGMLAGTSTGAILAGGLACGLSAQQLADLYEEHGPEIFTARGPARVSLFSLFASRYSYRPLRALLNRALGDRTLGDVQVPLILPAVDIGQGCVHVFKSAYDRRFHRDPCVRVADAVLASCAAPLYFDPVVLKHGEYQLADGGLWANNPALVAAVDARYRLGVSLDDIRVLSIGTGTSRAFYARSETRWFTRLLRACQGWGFTTRWQRTRLIDLILNLQSETAHNTLCLLLGESPLESKKVLRLTFESDHPLPLDVTAKRDDWINRADYLFTHHATRIADFLRLGAEDSDE
jgi:patatin-like phospholipase/acyl hydrolase